mmetsp:Transcript_4485/g.4209  ORF Transcript_4485/g.4209 Transcript_4485/m.4209 type:complete len:148 (-) Transcript_4485:3-446(-)
MKKNDRHFEMQIKKEEIGIFVKAGSIIPQKTGYSISSLAGIASPFMVEIFISPKNKEARGFFYMDDGETTSNVEMKEYSYLEFVFERNLELKVVYFHNNFEMGKGLVLNKIQIVGLKDQVLGAKIKDDDDEWVKVETESLSIDPKTS